MSRCSRRSTIVPADRLRPEAEAELSPLPVDQEQAFEVQSINNQRTKCSKQNAQAESPWRLIDLRDLRIRHKLRQTKNVSSRIPRLHRVCISLAESTHLAQLEHKTVRHTARGGFWSWYPLSTPAAPVLSFADHGERVRSEFHRKAIHHTLWSLAAVPLPCRFPVCFSWSSRPLARAPPRPRHGFVHLMKNAASHSAAASNTHPRTIRRWSRSPATSR